MTYLSETKLYLSEKKSYKDIANLMDCTSETAKRRILSTIDSLIGFFEFRAKGIEFPHIKSPYSGYRFCRWQLGNCKEHSDFWLKIIEDYENGVGSYKPPVIDDNERKISSLTVSEYKQLLKDILNHNQ